MTTPDDPDMRSSLRTVGQIFEMPSVGDQEELNSVKKDLDQIYLSRSKLNFESLYERGLCPLATDYLGNIDLVLRLVAQMWAGEVDKVYVVDGDVETPLTRQFTYSLPPLYDRDRLKAFFENLMHGEGWSVIDDAGRYCYTQVDAMYAFLIAPPDDFNALMRAEDWESYYQNFELLESYGYNEGETSDSWQEVIDSYFAVKAVQEYWRKTSFEPPASPAQQPSIEEVLEKYGAFNPNRPERLSSVEKRLRELADATGLSEEEIQSAFKGNVLDMGRILGLTKKKRDD